MKSINKAIANVFPDPSSFATLAQYTAAPAAPKPIIDEASARVVNLLFIELKAIHPAWRTAWPDKTSEAAAKIAWTKAFTSAGLRNIEQVRFGIERCRKNGSPFMASVGQFLEWCQPTAEDIGMPSMDRAYAMAAMYSHPAADRSQCHRAVYHAAFETGFHALSTRPEEVTRRRFEKHYNATIRILVAGGELHALPLPPERLISAKPSGDARSVGLAAIAAMRRKVKGGYSMTAQHEILIIAAALAVLQLVGWFLKGRRSMGSNKVLRSGGYRPRPPANPPKAPGNE